MSLDLRLTLGVGTVHSECEVLSKRGVFERFGLGV